MNQVFKDIYKTVWSEVFVGIKQLPIEKFVEIFTQDIDLPKNYKCQQTGKDVFMSKIYNYPRFVHEDILKDFNGKIDEVKDFEDLIKKIPKIAVFRGNKIMNSEVVENSDHIYSSNYIYNSQHIYMGQKMMFSENCSESEYLLACRGGSGSTFSIRLFDSSKTANSFEIDWSGNISNSYFIHDCFDLRDCMFCFHLRSKEYCIGNKQYTKEKYLELKKILLEEYINQLTSALKPVTGLRNL